MAHRGTSWHVMVGIRVKSKHFFGEFVGSKENVPWEQKNLSGSIKITERKRGKTEERRRSERSQGRKGGRKEGTKEGRDEGTKELGMKKQRNVRERERERGKGGRQGAGNTMPK